jgi:NAD(P)-dependent dehydrogenase (short-subunit alcohol dehydrogenase family)
VNNAGTGFPGQTLNQTQEQVEMTFGVNVFGAIYLVQAVIPRMPRGGRIINISSAASKIGMSNLATYGASKAATDSLTFAWAKEVCIFIVT